MQNRNAPVGTLLRSLRIPILAGFAPAKRKPLEIPFRFRQRRYVRGDRPVYGVWISRLQQICPGGIGPHLPQLRTRTKPEQSGRVEAAVERRLPTPGANTRAGRQPNAAITTRYFG